MSYLGVVDGDKKGLYYFETFSMRDAIADFLGNCKVYDNSQKKTALAELGLMSTDIQDGSVLIDLFKHDSKFIPPNSVYVYISGTPYKGAYYFVNKNVRDDIAFAFGRFAAYTNDKDSFKKYIPKSMEIENGGVLLRPEAKRWRDKHYNEMSGSSVDIDAYFTEMEEKAEERRLEKKRKAEEKKLRAENGDFDDVVEEVIEAKEPVSEAEVEKEIEVVETENSGNEDRPNTVIFKAQEKEINALTTDNVRVIFDVFKNTSEIVAIKMADGETYHVTFKNLYYASPETKLEEAIISDGYDNVIDAEKIAEWIEKGNITGVTKSKITFKEGFIILSNCDDKGTPTAYKWEDEDYVYFAHDVEKIALNINQIISIIPEKTYPNMRYTKVSAEEYPELNKYLYDNYLIQNK